MADDRQHKHAAQVGELSSDADLPVGAHLVTPRRGYTHHGIYAGDGDVVHYAGLSRSLHRGPVRKVPLQQFAAGHPVWIKHTTCPKYSGQQAIQRALSRLGEDCYRLATNNCEHFCEWCVGGESRSEQIDKLLVWPHTVLRAAIRSLARLGVQPLWAQPESDRFPVVRFGNRTLVAPGIR